MPISTGLTGDEPGTIYWMRGVALAVVFLLLGACGPSANVEAALVSGPPRHYGSDSGVVAAVHEGDDDPWAGGFTLRGGAHVAYPKGTVIARVDERLSDRYRAAEVRVGDEVEVWAYEDLLMSPPLLHAEYVLIHSSPSE